MMIPTFTCPFCNEEYSGSLSVDGDMPTGYLPQCSCPAFRSDWEAKHRAEVERRKQLRRTSKTLPLSHVGRTAVPANVRKRR